MATRQSKWAGLSRHLLATIYPVDARGDPIQNEDAVAAPITDGNVEITANWQSPFEQAGAESKAPAVMSMLQSGTFESYLLPLLGKGDEGSFTSRLSAEVTDFSRSAQGRSGMTKINSTQVFTGAAPVKVPVTMHFRAFDDPASEVQEPVDLLSQWALPGYLAPNGGLASAILALRNGQGFLKALLPSEAPKMVALVYGGYTFAPLVVESVSRPITVPRSSSGDMVHVAVQLMLSTVTAMDRGDWIRARGGRPIQLFNN